jgi:hypothetical protein
VQNVDPRFWLALVGVFVAAFVARRVRIRWARIATWRRSHRSADIARGAGRAAATLRKRR